MPPADDSYRLPLPDSVGALVRRGAKWSISLLVLRQVLGIGSLAVISRYLGPADFGLVAMATSLTGFLNLVADMGMTWATVQERELDRDKVNALFWFGAVLGLATWAAAVAGAPFLAHFYARPELRPICAAIGMSLLLNGLASQPVALLKRRIRQKAFSAIQTAASFAGAMVGISMAMAGTGYWALVGQLLTTPLVLLVLAIHQTAFLPGRPVFSSGVWSLLKFGGFVGMCNLVAYFQVSLDAVLIGYHGGAAEVGYYSRACFLKSIPAVYAAVTLTDIMVPALSALRADPQRLAAAYRKTVRVIAFVGCPLGVFLGITAPETVRMVYGRGWEPVVPILYWLSLPGIVLPVYTTMGWLYLAAGKARDMFLQAVVATALAGAAFSWGVRWGSLGVACAAAALFTIPLPLASLYLAHRAARIEFGPTLRSIHPIFLASLVAAAGGCAAGWIASSLGICWQAALVGKALGIFTLYGVAAFYLVRPFPLPFIERAAVMVPRKLKARDRLKDWLPPAALRLGRRLVRRGRRLLRPTSSGLDGAVEHRIGNISLLLPGDHPLPKYQSAWSLYDIPLRHLADALREATEGGYRAIDIGANVGDTAAAINAGGTTPVLCIEGDPAYFAFLDRNARAVGPQVVVEKCFVGDADGQADARKLDRRQGTTVALTAIQSAAGGLPVRRLESILLAHPEFDFPQLVKIDTDGCDFSIILSHLPYLSTRKPVLFFEYIVDSAPAYRQSLECIDGLIGAGYEQFLVFDNFGNFLLSTTSKQTLQELSLYLLSHAAFGAAVYYLDICAMAGAQRNVADILREKLAALTLGRVGEETPARGRAAA